MRTIDADALMEVINRHCYPVQHDMTSIEPGMTLVGIIQAVQEQPTVEPERKTGRWTNAYDGNDGHVKCTGCFKTYDWISQAQYYNYCPNCGADMRGDKDDQR